MNCTRQSPEAAAFVRSWCAVIVALTLLASPALLLAATFQSMAQRLPATTDAIVAINVEQVLDSPFAKEQKWRETLVKRPELVSLGLRKVLMGAEFVPSKAEDRWEVTLLEMAKMPSVTDMCQAEGGNIDRVWDKDAVVSPINAYFVPIDADLLAVCTPAERTAIVRWVRQPIKPEGAVASEYIKGVLAKLSDETYMVMAMDLDGAYGLPNIRRFLDNSELEALKGKDLDTMAQTLSTLKGLMLQVTVDKNITGRLVISFDKSTADLNSGAKPLFIAVLKAAGMYLEDVDQWSFTADGKEVRAMGELSEASFQRLVGLVQSPVPTAVAAAATPQAATPADPATASQRYFKSVSLILDNLKTGTSVQETATWWLQASKRIDKLPILNVDPALVEWGSFVSMKLKQLAGVGAAGQTQMQARIAGVANPDYGGSYYDENGYYHYEGDYRRAGEEYQRQRRQAALEQKAQIQQQAVQILNETNGSRQKIRVEMSTKYKVEF